MTASQGTRPGSDVQNSVHSVQRPIQTDANGPLKGTSPIAKLLREEYARPDICLLGSLHDASDDIRAELREIGDERRYPTALRMLKAKGQAISNLAAELLSRYEKAGEA
jgi:hypothetical protein